MVPAPDLATATPPSSSRRRGKFFLAVAVIVFVVASFGGGYYVGQSRGIAQGLGSGQVFGRGGGPPPGKYLGKDVDFKLFWEVWNVLQQEYVDRPVSDTKLFYGALQGLVSGVGDPYTVFFDPDTAKKFDQELSGSFEGIGAEIGLRSGQIVVIAPLPGTPAERAGVKSGDAILSIDGKDTNGMSLDAAVSAIRGKGGTTVTLRLLRAGQSKAFEEKIVRQTINVQSVTSSMKSSGSGRADIAYIKIAQFNEDATKLFSQAVAQVMNHNPRAVILDLRNNPGGLLDAAVEVSSYWVDHGSVVVEQLHDGSKEEYPAKGTAALKGLKTIVLVNGGSASAAEIVSGALQDDGLATLLGEKTFGKGSVQELKPLSDGSAVKITVAKWLTPKGRSINEAGITPDITMKVEQDTLKPGQDPELDRALELLQKP